MPNSKIETGPFRVCRGARDSLQLAANLLQRAKHIFENPDTFDGAAAAAPPPPALAARALRARAAHRFSWRTASMVEAVACASAAAAAPSPAPSVPDFLGLTLSSLRKLRKGNICDLPPSLFHAVHASGAGRTGGRWGRDGMPVRRRAGGATRREPLERRRAARATSVSGFAGAAPEDSRTRTSPASMAGGPRETDDLRPRPPRKAWRVADGGAPARAGRRGRRPKAGAPPAKEGMAGGRGRGPRSHTFPIAPHARCARRARPARPSVLPTAPRARGLSRVPSSAPGCAGPRAALKRPPQAAGLWGRRAPATDTEAPTTPGAPARRPPRLRGASRLPCRTCQHPPKS